MGSHVALGYPWRLKEVETTMHKLVMMACLGSSALACAVRSEASAPEYVLPDDDGHISDSTCSISDGFDHHGAGLGGMNKELDIDKEIIGDGFSTGLDGGTLVISDEGWGGD